MREEDELSTKTSPCYKKPAEEDSASINMERVPRHTDSLSHSRGQERETGEKEMNKFKRHQQPHLTQVTFYSSSNL